MILDDTSNMHFQLLKAEYYLVSKFYIGETPSDQFRMTLKQKAMFISRILYKNVPYKRSMCI